MTQLFANNAYGSLGSTLSNSATSLTLGTGHGGRFPSPTGGDYFTLTLIGVDSNGSENAWEIVKVTGRSTDALTLVRAQEGTTAATWTAGTRVELRATAGTLDSFTDATEAAAAAPVQSVNGYTGAVALTKSDVGLSAVENKSSATIRGELTSGNVTTALGFTPENAANKGAANGYAPLGSDSKIASTYLPSYVDDVLEYANYAALPAIGETGKIYVLATPYTSGGITSSQFRWGGSAYSAIIASPGSTDAVTEGSVNLYFTNARAQAALAAPTFTGGITVSSGGASITGNSTVTGTLSASGITNTQTESVVALTSTAGSARNWQLVSGGGTLGAAGNFYLRNATSGAAPVIVDGAAANGTVYVGSTGLAVSGNIISGLTTRTVYNYSGGLGALSNGLRLRTPLGYASDNFYQLTIRGYHYRNGGSADLTICWYGYSSVGYPIQTSVTTSGGWNPTIRLGNNAGTTDIYFALDDSDGYVLFFDVDVTSLAAVPSSGWAVADVAYSSGGVLVPYIQKLGRAAAVTGTGGDSRLAVGQGITFPATQNPSSDANTLDDYEEGTWTPADGSGAGLTFSSAVGTYTKVGRLVTATFLAVYPATADASSAMLSGLPFSSGAGNLSSGAAITYKTYGSPISAITATTTLNFYGSTGSVLTNANLGGADIRGVITYYV